MKHGRSRMPVPGARRHVPLLVIGLLPLAACQADVAEPSAAASPSGAFGDAPSIATADLILMGTVVDDAAERLAPGLDDALASEVVGLFVRLADALAAADVVRARHAVAGARAALGPAAETPDGAAIGLALDDAELLLSGHGFERRAGEEPSASRGRR